MLKSNKIGEEKKIWCITLTRIITFANRSQSSDVTQYYFTCTNACSFGVYACSFSCSIFEKHTKRTSQQRGGGEKKNRTTPSTKCYFLSDAVICMTQLHLITFYWNELKCARLLKLLKRKSEQKKKNCIEKCIWLKGDIFLTTDQEPRTEWMTGDSVKSSINCNSLAMENDLKRYVK